MNKYIKLVGIKLVIGLFFIPVFTLGSCRAQSHKNEQVLEEIIDQVWIHSYEDDSSGIKAYREQGYNFPPARGREGFQLNADSTFVLYKIAPTDGTQKKKGRWTFKDGKLEISFDEKQSDNENFILELISFENGLLKARQVQ